MMKQVRSFLILALLGFVLIGKTNAFAMETGFSIEKMSSNEIELFLDNVNITMFVSEPIKEAIKCFDVNENGMIAIGTENSKDKQVCIYSADGKFQYGYRFNTAGSFGIEMDNDIVNVYFVRSDVAISINSVGEIENISKISNTTENKTYWNHSVRATKRSVGECEYILKNDIGFLGLFASSYSQLYKIDTSGEEKLIYDANSFQFLHSISIFVGVIAFVSIVVFVIIRQFKILQQENNHVKLK